MPSGFTQERRFLKLTTPLGPDTLLIESFTISERLSENFEIEIDALAELSKRVDPAALLGQSVTIPSIWILIPQDARYFNGIVREVNVGSDSDRFRGFRLHAVPSLWLVNPGAKFPSFRKKDSS